MTRLACALQLAALAVLVMFLVEPTGLHATAFTFLGMPLVLLGLIVYALRILRRDASRISATREGRSR